MKKQYFLYSYRKIALLFSLVLLLCYGLQMAANAQMSAERRFSGECVSRRRL